MLVKLIIIGLLIAIVVSLLTSMVFLVKDRSDKRRTLTGLKIRIGLSITLLLFLLFSYHEGWIRPHGLIPPPEAGSPPAP